MHRSAVRENSHLQRRSDHANGLLQTALIASCARFSSSFPDTEGLHGGREA
jgi:hypothetical protein